MLAGTWHKQHRDAAQLDSKHHLETSMNMKHIQKIIIAAICGFSLIGPAAAQKNMTSAPGMDTTDKTTKSVPGTTETPAGMNTAPGTNPQRPLRSAAPGPTAAPGAITTAPGMATPAYDYGGATAPTEAESRLIASGWRISKLNKTIVYNDANEKIGKIDDFIVTKDGSLIFAVVNLGRLPKRGTYMVAVPMDKFSQIIPKIILPGVTKADLEKLPKFHYKLLLGK